jgi:ABC-type branched-subunit amino acid transport system ATPase component
MPPPSDAGPARPGPAGAAPAGAAPSGAAPSGAAPAGAAPAGAPPLLELDGLVAGYGGGDVLHGVSFSVPAGGITCVVGPNGAGKSTLLAVISGLLRPRQGRVLLRGAPITGHSPRQVLALGVVHVPQQHSLFRDMTVRENIDLGGYTIADRSLVARRRRAVEELFPEVAGWAGQKAGSLSGGQQRLVEFARGLMLDPDLVILDEPSMGLSPRVLRSVFGAVRMMNAAGKTILLVEQNARAGLRLSTHGVVLENGRVRLAGTGREVLEHPEIGALYLGGSVAGGPVPDGPVRDGPVPDGPVPDGTGAGGAVGPAAAAPGEPR